MRALLSALLLASLFVSSPASATPSAGPKNTLTVNPIGLLLGGLSLEYERAASPGMSWYIGPSYWGLSFSGGSLDGWGLEKYDLSGGLRLFPGGRSPGGFYIGPTASVGVATVSSPSSSSSATTWSLGAGLGYTWLVGDVFDISLGLGAAYMEAEAEVEGRTEGSSGIWPSLRFAIGPAF